MFVLAFSRDTRTLLRYDKKSGYLGHQVNGSALGRYDRVPSDSSFYDKA